MLRIHQMAAEKSDRLFKATRELHNNKNNQYEQTHSIVTLQTEGGTLNGVFAFLFLPKVKCCFDPIGPNRRNNRVLPSTSRRPRHLSP